MTPLQTVVPGSLPLRRDDASLWQTDGLHPFGALGIVLVLAGICGLFLWRHRARRRGVGAPAHGLPGWRQWALPRADGGLGIVQSARLTPGASLHVVRWNDTLLLVGCSGQGLTLVAQQTATPPPHTAPSGHGAPE